MLLHILYVFPSPALFFFLIFFFRVVYLFSLIYYTGVLYCLGNTASDSTFILELTVRVSPSKTQKKEDAERLLHDMTGYTLWNAMQYCIPEASYIPSPRFQTSSVPVLQVRQILMSSESASSFNHLRLCRHSLH